MKLYKHTCCSSLAHSDFLSQIKKGEQGRKDLTFHLVALLLKMTLKKASHCAKKIHLCKSVQCYSSSAQMPTTLSSAQLQNDASFNHIMQECGLVLVPLFFWKGS